MKITAKVDFSGFDTKKILRDVMANYEREAQQKISGMTCPEHGQTPKVVSKGTDGFEIRACCDEHAKRAADRLLK